MQDCFNLSQPNSTNFSQLYARTTKTTYNDAGKLKYEGGQRTMEVWQYTGETIDL